MDTRHFALLADHNLVYLMSRFRRRYGSVMHSGLAFHFLHVFMSALRIPNIAPSRSLAIRMKAKVSNSRAAYH